MKNKQRELLQICSDRDETLSGVLKRAKNASKLCTVLGLPRNWKFESIFANPSRDVTDPFKIQNKQRELLQISSSSILVFTNGFKMC